MTPLTALEIVRVLVGLILDLMPVEEAAGVLHDEAVKRQNRIADEAERLKFSP